jgi:hypothetical protein
MPRRKPRAPDEFPTKYRDVWAHVVDNNAPLTVQCSSYGEAVNLISKLHQYRASLRNVADGEVKLVDSSLHLGRGASVEMAEALWRKFQRAYIPRPKRGDTSFTIHPVDQQAVDTLGNALEQATKRVAAEATEETASKPELPLTLPQAPNAIYSAFDTDEPED